ncbi:MAG: hypothetical protein U0T77_09105 [Chitinophagales bacterium]
MKKLFLHINAFLVLMFFVANLQAQNPSSVKEFDALWEKTAQGNGKTGNVTKDLNALEREKIKSIDIKEKNLNPNAKKIDTTNLEIFSTKPVIKGATYKNKTTDKPKEELVTPKETISATPAKAVKDTVKVKKEVIKTKEELKSKTIPAPAAETKLKEEVKPKPEVKPAPKTEDFSTQPIIKGKKTIETSAPAVTESPKKFSIDTTKKLRDFSFETTPVINKNASYNRRDEPMPKSKEQIDDEIPVNRKPNNTNIGKDDAFIKETYAQYNKEADSLHLENKRRLDSIMKSLNIKVPVVINPGDYIDIYVNGGGTLLNNDSKIYDRISILHTGVVQREYKTKNEGVQRMEKKISRDELTKLAQYIVDMDFFDFKEEYDCADNDAACNDRLNKSPQPVPMDISVTVGQRKNKVDVSLFAPKSEKNWVQYPANLEKIMNAIYAIVGK